MSDQAAVRVAIDMLQVPSRVRLARAAQLPGGVLALLQIAAGDAEVIGAAVVASGKPERVVRDAASFFIEQIMLSPDADSYRVLGASAEATSGELRRNMALLLKWLHPDMERNGGGRSDRSMFAGRVTLAWDKLKTPERRAAYDIERQRRDAKQAARRGKSGKQPGKHRSGERTSNGTARGRRGGLWRALLNLIGGAR